MDIKALSSHLTVSEQIQIEDIPKLAGQGIKTVLVHRPDGEGDGQPAHTDIASAASAHGMELKYIPVTPGNITEADLTLYRDAIARTQAPRHAYCKSGARAAMLWSLTRPATETSDSLIEAAASIGIDISSLKPRLDQR